MLDYCAFLEKIQKELQRELGNTARVTLQEVTKNNNVKLDSVLIQEEGTNVSPAIYLKSFYEDYQKGMVLPAIIGKILNSYRESRSAFHFDPSCMSDFQKVKKRIVPRVIHWEKNEERLRNVPYVKYLDLAIVYYYLVEEYPNGSAAILIQNTMLDMWEIESSALYDQAFKNMREVLPMDFCSMKDMLEKMTGKEFPEDVPQNDVLYVISNSEKSFGAVWIADQEALEKIYHKVQSDYYVLPSSVHECMILLATENTDEKMLTDMVKEVNETQVDPEEVLSDRIYRYCAQDRVLELI